MCPLKVQLPFLIFFVSPKSATSTKVNGLVFCTILIIVIKNEIICGMAIGHQ